MPAFAAKHPGGVPEATTKLEGRAEPPKATPRPPQGHILGIDSGVQSHLKATPRLHQGSTKAPPRLYQGYLIALCQSLGGAKTTCLRSEEHTSELQSLR